MAAHTPSEGFPNDRVMGSSPLDGSGRPGPAFSAAELDAIIGRSSTLAERLTGEVVPTGREHVLAAKRLDRWKRLAANGEEAGFRRLPGPLGPGTASDEELRRLLGEVAPAPGSDLPPWAALLRQIVPAVSAAFASGESRRRVHAPGAHRSIPFVELYRPIVALAREQVEAMSSARGERMRDGAWRGLEGWLLERISTVCSLALQPRFLAFQAVRRPGASLARFDTNPRAPAAGGTASLFEAFIDEQGRQGLCGFFLDYPVAARLTAQVVRFWIDFTAEFLARLEADAGEISVRFLARRSIGKIIRLKAGISDPHRGGRSVLSLHFESGLRLVYKPRPMQIDAAFSELLSWLNAEGHSPPLHRPEILAGESHGWESFVAYSPCRNRREAKHFFQRAGALLYLVHALRGVDFHRENMIATAEGPVLVDLEGLCHPPFPEAVMLDDGAGGRWPFESSIFRTGLLPVPGRRPDGRRFSDLSALSGSILQRSPATDVRWRNINSDQMEAAPGSARLVCGTHRARLHGRLLSIRDHGRELAAGFQRLARFFRADKRAASRWPAAVATMYGLQTRLIKRPTFLYATMIDRSLQPRFLVEGIDRSIEFQALPSTGGDEDDRRAELAALEMLDVPAFFQRPETLSRAGHGSSEPENGLASQMAAIRVSTASRRVRSPNSRGRPPRR